MFILIEKFHVDKFQIFKHDTNIIFHMGQC